MVALTLGVGAQEGERPRRQRPPRGEGEPRSACMQAARQAHQQAVRGHMEAQREKNQAFREGLGDLPPTERVEAVIRHRVAQHEASVAFLQKAHEDLVTAVRACADVEDAVKQEQVAGLLTRHQEATARRQEAHERMIASLKEIQGSDASAEEKLAALRRLLTEGRRPREGRPRRQPDA